MTQGQETQPRTLQTVVRWTARILLAGAVVYFAYKIGGLMAI